MSKKMSVLVTVISGLLLLALSACKTCISGVNGRKNSALTQCSIAANRAFQGTRHLISQSKGQAVI